ncbi:MAG TPA: ATP-binding cassette domain-containing protein [Chthoniobacteraceae bacterium]|jgi:ABC-2 type transport system ATP-binding protein|nr:ATP-binding cassette domain-containing protein [Chthoniobacteraceae bacterium]
MIQVRNLSKNFGPKWAVNNISLDVAKGEVLGFLGPNGAGKSTTMRMITGFLPPASGEIRVGGHDMLAEPIAGKRLIGYLPEHAPAYTDMTVTGFLRFCAEMRGLGGDAKRRAVSRVIETCFLESVTHQSVETLSKGYRHRLCFAQAILHDPEVLIMDEPTDGLDPNQKHEVRTIIREMGARKAIIFSTHILEEVEAVCSRAIIIDRGAIVANGTPQELKARGAGAGAVTVRFAAVPGGAVAALEQLDGVEKVSVIGKEPLAARVFPKAGKKDLGTAIFELAAREQWKLADLHAEEGRLDEVFRAITLPDTK